MTRTAHKTLMPRRSEPFFWTEICKMIKASIVSIFLFSTFECLGQNIYGSYDIYYNMDTTWCVNNDAGTWEGSELKPHSGNPDSTGLYCIFKEYIDIPIVTVNDDSIIHLIDSCIIDAKRRKYLQFPGSFGYFVELVFYPDSLMSILAITTISNYYMADVLSSDRNEVFQEWYGCNEKNIQGAFYLNNILCVIASYGLFDYGRASCLFSQTQSNIRIALLSPIKMIVLDDTLSSFGCYFPNCDSEPESTDIKGTGESSERGRGLAPTLLKKNK